MNNESVEVKLLMHCGTSYFAPVEPLPENWSTLQRWANAGKKAYVTLAVANAANPLPPKQDAPKPPAQESCGNCRFDHSTPLVAPLCRRYPEYVVRDATDWCGEWRAKA